MTDTTLAFPLNWPPTQPRTAKPARARFDTLFGVARSHLLDELRLLGARDIVISSNVPLRRDGLPMAARSQPDDPAVAVWFMLDGQQLCFPCDQWTTVTDNLRAIGLTVAALRGIRRWGSSAMMHAAFTGFAALPAQSETGWWTVLDVSPAASRSEIEAAYRAKARTAHPDAGGDAEAFLAIQRAYEQAKAVAV